MKAKEIIITCYENEVPPFVETEVEQLYGNIFSSLLEFRIYGWKGARTSTYMESSDGNITTLLLFEREKGRVRVLNESIRVGAEGLQRFSDYIFSRYDDVNVISFKAIETDIHSLRFPYQRFNYLEDITLAMPIDGNEYHASLGKNTRRNIKRYGDRLRKTFPAYRFDVYERDQVQEEHVRQLIAFNHARMAEKNIQSVIDEEETRRIVELAQACGLVGIATIDGKVVGGAVSYRSGSNYFLNILAHDPSYDDFWVGFLCCYETIRACIARHGKEFHFLWGRYDYKFALGAVQRDLDNVTIYRSRLQLLLNGNVAWREAAWGFRRQATVWVKYEDTWLACYARKLVEHWREFKRSTINLALRRRSTA